MTISAHTKLEVMGDSEDCDHREKAQFEINKLKRGHDGHPQYQSSKLQFSATCNARDWGRRMLNSLL